MGDGLARFVADAVVVVHLGFIVFVATGALLAWRWPRVLWLHVPALAWGVTTLTVGLACPLTALEKHLRRLAGDGYSGGFVDHYVEGVVYPEEHAAALRTVAGLLIVAGYAGVVRRLVRIRQVPSGGEGVHYPLEVVEHGA